MFEMIQTEQNWLSSVKR